MTDQVETEIEDPRPAGPTREDPTLTELPTDALAAVHGGMQIFSKAFSGKTITLDVENQG